MELSASGDFFFDAGGQSLVFAIELGSARFPEWGVV